MHGTWDVFCLPGGLRGPSNLPIPPTGGAGPAVPLTADGGGIFKEPELMCRYSDGILEGPVNIAMQAVRLDIELSVCVEKSRVSAFANPASKWGICVAWRCG